MKSSHLCATDGCDDAKAPGSQWCADCGRYYARPHGDAGAARRRAKRGRGECLQCKAAAEPGRSLCSRHAELNRARWHARKGSNAGQKRPTL